MQFKKLDDTLKFLNLLKISNFKSKLENTERRFPWRNKEIWHLKINLQLIWK